MLSTHLHIPAPENLSDEMLVRKLRQLEWLMQANHLQVKLKEGAKLLPDINSNITDGEEKDY